MKIVVQSIGPLEANVFEVKLNMDNRLCRGTLTREAVGPIFLWHANSKLSECWQGVGLLSKHVISIVGDFSRGEKINFPVDLGDF